MPQTQVTGLNPGPIQERASKGGLVEWGLLRCVNETEGMSPSDLSVPSAPVLLFAFISSKYPPPPNLHPLCCPF